MPPPRREFVVDRDDDGSRMETFLRRRLGLARTAAMKALRKGWVRLDGKRAEGSSLLARGQRVKITNYGLPLPAIDGPQLSTPRADIPPGVLTAARASLRHVDRDLVVSAKPAGFVVHAGSGHAWGWIDALALVLPPEPSPGSADSPEPSPGSAGKGLPSCPSPGSAGEGREGALRPHPHAEDMDEPGAAPSTGGLVPIGRLDRDTSGLLVVARTRFAARALFAALRAGTLDRTYTAIVRGELRGEQGTIDLPLEKEGDEGHERMEPSDAGREARTRWRVARRLDGATLVTLELDTGRTHQLRAHLASQGHAILGDPRYQDDAARALSRRLDVERLCLHAGALRLPDPTTGVERRFEEPLPAEMARIVAVLDHT